MDTYGDLVTLLLTFFILLFAMSSISSEKYNQFIASFGKEQATVMFNTIRGSEVVNMEKKGDNDGVTDMTDGVMDNQDIQKPGRDIVDGGNQSEADRQRIETIMRLQDELAQTAEYKAVDQEFDYLYNRLRVYVQGQGLADVLEVERNDQAINIRMLDTLLFRSGQADFTPEALEVLDKVGLFLNESIRSISLVNIEGHTDNVPISNSRYSDNWDLSSKRATNALRRLNNVSGIPLEKLAAVAYGEQQPIADNNTPEGRALNRRVCFEVIKRNVLDEMIEDAQAN